MGVVAAAALCVLFALIWLWWRIDRPIALPRPRGPHAVGRQLFDWVDGRRGRELMVFLWYPAEPGSTHAPAEYVPGRWGQLAAQGMFPLPARRIQQIRVSATERAPILAGRHPLVVLLPAMGRIATDYTTLAEDLASFGYMVAGVTPTGSARVVVFSDGRVVRGTDGVDLAHRDQAQWLVDRWVGDSAFVLDRLSGEPELWTHVDANRIGVFGHSFGGAAAMHALRRDRRFQRGANLDGAPQGAEVSGLDRPLLIVFGAPLPPPLRELNDRIWAESKRICESDASGCRWEYFPEAGHMNFSDAGVLPSRFPVPRSRLDLTRIDGPAFLRRVSDLLREFFDGM
jgi:dienelactone hydrolase